jgi:putative peptidoglycan lipid II flippase
VVANIIFNLILIGPLAHTGLALTTSISISLVAWSMFLGLRRKIGSLGAVSYLKCGLKAGAASVVMGFVTYFVCHGLYGLLGVSKFYNLVSLLSAAGIGALVYRGLCYLLGVDEARMVVGAARKRLKG